MNNKNDKSITIDYKSMIENSRLYIAKSWFKEYRKYKDKYKGIKKVLKEINKDPIKREISSIREERKFNSNEDCCDKYNKYKDKYEKAKEKLKHIRRWTKPIKQTLEELREEYKKELELLRKDIDLLKGKINNIDDFNTKNLTKDSVSIPEKIIKIKEEPISDIKIDSYIIINNEIYSNIEISKDTKINKKDLVDYKLGKQNWEIINNKLIDLRIIPNNFNKLELYLIINK